MKKLETFFYNEKIKSRTYRNEYLLALVILSIVLWLSVMYFGFTYGFSIIAFQGALIMAFHYLLTFEKIQESNATEILSLLEKINEKPAILGSNKEIEQYIDLNNPRIHYEYNILFLELLDELTSSERRELIKYLIELARHKRRGK